MKKTLITLIAMATAMTMTSITSAQDWAPLSQDWVTTSGQIGLNGNIRGVCANPATGNVIVSDTGGTIAVLNPTTGALVKNISGAATSDSTVPCYRVRVSDDGYIYTSGYSATVKIVGDESTTDASGSPEISVGAAGNCRNLEVIGSHTAGTARIFVARGATVYVFGNTPGDTATYSQLDTITTPYANELEGVCASPDGTIVYTFSTNDSAPELKRWTGAIGSGYTLDAGFTAPWQDSFRNSVDVEFDHNTLSMASGHGGDVPYLLTLVLDLDGNAKVGPGIDGGGSANSSPAPVNTEWFNITTGTSNLVGDTSITTTGEIFSAGNDSVVAYSTTAVPVELSAFGLE